MAGMMPRDQGQGFEKPRDCRDFPHALRHPGTTAMRLSARGLTCQRSGRIVFAGLDFTVESGEALLVLGRNGAGKSSLLRTIAGLVRGGSGRLTLEGGAAEVTLGEQAHYVGHQDALKSALTVRENLDFWARYLGADAPEGGGLPADPLAALALD